MSGQERMLDSLLDAILFSVGRQPLVTSFSHLTNFRRTLKAAALMLEQVARPARSDAYASSGSHMEHT